MTTPNIPQFIDITSWNLSEQGQTGAMYGEGALSKFLLKDEHGQQWMFKETWHRIKSQHGYDEELHHQYWCEVIASMLGYQMEIDVPETHIGYGEHPSGEISFFIGVLSKWFVVDDKVFISGRDSLEGSYHHMNMAFTEKDCTYDLSVIAMLAFDSFGLFKSNFDKLREKKIETLTDFPLVKNWLNMTIFDIVIGNTDRHYENWAVLMDVDGICTLAPAYDNGVSLGFRQDEESIVSDDLRKDVVENLWKKYRYKYKALQGGHRKVSDIIRVLKDMGVEKDSLLLSLVGVTTTNLQEIRKNAMILNKKVLQESEKNPNLAPYVLSDNRLEFMLRSIEYRAEKLKELINDIYQ